VGKIISAHKKAPPKQGRIWAGWKEGLLASPRQQRLPDSFIRRNAIPRSDRLQRRLSVWMQIKAAPDPTRRPPASHEIALALSYGLIQHRPNILLGKTTRPRTETIFGRDPIQLGQRPTHTGQINHGAHAASIRWICDG
jgi:hypothetical protein